jgi:hypothetical protein
MLSSRAGQTARGNAEPAEQEADNRDNEPRGVIEGQDCVHHGFEQDEG